MSGTDTLTNFNTHFNKANEPFEVLINDQWEIRIHLPRPVSPSAVSVSQQQE